MSDSLIGSVFRVMLYSLLLIFAVVTMLFVYNVGTMNSFISQTNAIVSRSGGLTQTAYDKINKMSSDHYHGMYHVTYKDIGSRNDVDNNMGDKYDRTGAVITKEGITNDKGFNDDPNKAGTYWQNDQTDYGQPATYHVYADIPYDPPFTQNLAIHTGVKGKPDNNKSLSSVAERVDSDVRPGSQE